MAETPRPKPVEYYNPRPLILGVCFFWGVAMGFCLFYFSPPKQIADPGYGREQTEVVLPKNPASDLERRRSGTPDIAPVTPAPKSVVPARPRLESMEIDPPTPSLTTEGGLTGRTAHLLLPTQPRAPSQRPPSESGTLRPTRKPPAGSPTPPLPELFP